ncbi:MAG: GDSL-type esterase/lipase family protein [Polaribacter sp.]
MKKYNLFNITSIVLVLIFINGCTQLKTLFGNKLAKLYPPQNTVIKYHTDWTEKYYPVRIKEFEAAPLKKREIVFLGNSITEQGKDWSAKFNIKNIRNRGLSGDVTDGVLKRLGEIIYYKPKAIFILIGINDLYNLYDEQQIPSAEYVGNNILKIAKEFHKKIPKTKIYIRTLLPTRNKYMKDNILIVNKIIKDNEKNGYYKCIDLHSQFTDEEGLLIKKYAFDKTHLNAKGYAHWITFEKPLLVKVVNNLE